MIIYIDSEFKCHVNYLEGFTPVETSFFEGKDSTYIENHRFIPKGQIWIRNDGMVFEGEFIINLDAERLLQNKKKKVNCYGFH